MARQLLIAALIILATVLAGAGSSRPSHAAIDADWVVDDGLQDCLTLNQGATHQHIVDALAVAQTGDTIFVCDGTYPEPSLFFGPGGSKEGVALLGPGWTPEDDGVATITFDDSPGLAMVQVHSDFVQIRGMNFDATGSRGPEIIASNVAITNNVFSNGGSAVSYGGQGSTNANITNNTLINNFEGIICFCPNSYVDINQISTDKGWTRQIDVDGANIHISNNTVTDGYVRMNSDMGRVSSNSIDGGGLNQTLLYVVGNSVNILSNDLRNTTGTGMQISDRFQGTVDTTGNVLGNIFTSVAKPIVLHDDDPNAGFTVKMTLGLSSPPAGNTFIDSGGTLDDELYLLQLDKVTENVPAENNDWGYCSLADIEKQIYHRPDDPALGTVDYVPFVEPNPCPTDTPSPTPSSTLTTSPTPSGSPTASPSSTPNQHLTQGDVNCDGFVDLDDFRELLRYAAGLSDGTMPDCLFNLGDDLGGSLGLWGDFNCDGIINELDALAVLVYASGAMPLVVPGGCVAIGQEIET